MSLPTPLATTTLYIAFAAAMSWAAVPTDLNSSWRRGEYPDFIRDDVSEHSGGTQEPFGFFADREEVARFLEDLFGSGIEDHFVCSDKCLWVDLAEEWTGRPDRNHQLTSALAMLLDRQPDRASRYSWQ